MSKLSDARKAEFAKAFKSVDKDGSGELDRRELFNLFKRLGHTVGKKELSRIIAQADTKGKGTINLEDLLRVVDDVDEHVDADLHDTFNLFDTNKNGFIDASELKTAMKTFYGQDLTDEEASAMIKEADGNGDNQINFDEFKKIMLQK